MPLTFMSCLPQPVDAIDRTRAAGRLVDRAERIVDVRRHEDATDRVDHEHTAGHGPASTGVSRSKIHRANAELQRVDVLHERALIPYVVPVRDDVATSIVQLARDLRGESCATRGVLAVHDDE